MKKSILALLCVLLSIPCAFAYKGDIIKVGDDAPLFNGTSSAGATIDLEALKGKVVLINFFATWCGPCNEEMPVLESKIWTSYRDNGIVLIAIGREHSTSEVAAFKLKKRLTFEFMGDPNREIYSKYASEYIPRCYLIGKDGRVKFVTVGYNPAEFEQLIQAVDAELKS